MTESTVSAKNQIMVPREAGKALTSKRPMGMKPGDKLLVVLRQGPEPKGTDPSDGA